MTNPRGYLVRMLVFLAIVLLVAGILSHVLLIAFANNPVLNSLILGVLVFGGGWNLRQVARLAPEAAWVDALRGDGGHGAAPPRLLAPMASMLMSRNRGGRISLSTTAMRTLLDGLASRLDESRELSRYMTGLLIFLGLLGTFWGLLLTVGAVGDVIAGMSVGSGDINAMFEQLKAGLAKPLHGMGTAFSSSMFGLSGALVLGFLDLTAGQAQNRFFNELEEWLASLTRLSSGILGAEGEATVPQYVQALLEQTAENMEGLQRVIARGEERGVQANQAVIALTDRISALSETMRTSQQLMLRIAEDQARLGPVLARLAEPRNAGADEAMRMHLRNIEAALQRLLVETEAGRAQSTAELRGDIRVLTRTIAAIAEETPP